MHLPARLLLYVKQWRQLQSVPHRLVVCGWQQCVGRGVSRQYDDQCQPRACLQHLPVLLQWRLSARQRQRHHQGLRAVPCGAILLERRRFALHRQLARSPWVKHHRRVCVRPRLLLCGWRVPGVPSECLLPGHQQHQLFDVRWQRVYAWGAPKRLPNRLHLHGGILWARRLGVHAMPRWLLLLIGRYRRLCGQCEFTALHVAIRKLHVQRGLHGKLHAVQRLSSGRVRVGDRQLHVHPV